MNPAQDSSKYGSYQNHVKVVPCQDHSCHPGVNSSPQICSTLARVFVFTRHKGNCRENTQKLLHEKGINFKGWRRK